MWYSRKCSRAIGCGSYNTVWKLVTEMLLMCVDFDGSVVVCKWFWAWQYKLSRAGYHPQLVITLSCSRNKPFFFSRKKPFFYTSKQASQCLVLIFNSIIMYLFYNVNILCIATFTKTALSISQTHRCISAASCRQFKQNTYYGWNNQWGILQSQSDMTTSTWCEPPDNWAGCHNSFLW